MKVETLPKGLRRSLVLSIGVHVAVVVGLVVATTGTARSRRKSETVITAKLVRLGVERPKEFLPRKDEPLPGAPKPVAVPMTDKPSNTKVLSGKDPTAEKHSLSDALSRLKKSSQDAPEGVADGSPDGEVSSAAQALAGSLYLGEVRRCVKAYYDIEGVSQDRAKNRTALVFVRIQADGTLFDKKVERGSGLPAMDRAVDKALKRCPKVSPPPKELLEQVRDGGIEFEFQP